jgi:hypothetical protein
MNAQTTRICLHFIVKGSTRQNHNTEKGKNRTIENHRKYRHELARLTKWRFGWARHTNKTRRKESRWKRKTRKLNGAVQQKSGRRADEANDAAGQHKIK